jgi:hypothetical protein
MKTELKTKSGNKVTNVQTHGDIIIGYVNVRNETLVWDKNGRRSPKKKSKLDLELTNKYHIAIRKWGNVYKSRLYDNKPSGKGIIKIIEVEI